MRRGVGLGLVGTVVATLGLGLAKYTSIFDSSIPITVRENGADKVLNFPGYNPVKVPPGNCTRYARMAAEELFGKEFPPADAWDRMYVDSTTPVESTLERLAAHGTLKPGMLVGLRNPHTSRTEQKDREGKPAAFTHIGLYLGVNADGKAIIGEQYGSRKIVGTEQELRERSLVPLYIFDVKTPTAAPAPTQR